MRPIRLTIDGINSFKQRQTLDFSQLSSDLFCVFGDTGAGKSTILDSMILALFGECNRGDSVRGTDFINLECDKAEVEFEFAMEGGVYRIVREFATGSGGESKKKARLFADGNLVTAQATEAGRIIREIVGLSMEDFTQVVVLEQGRFNRFLSSSRKERSLTVAKLFKLDKYKDLQFRADKALSGVNAKMKNIEFSVLPFAGFTEERLKELDDSLVALKLDCIKNDKALQNAAENSKRLAEQKLAYDAAVRSEKRRQELKPLIEGLQEKLAQYKQVLEQDKDKYTAAKADKDRLTVELDRLENLMPRFAEKAECEEKLQAAGQRVEGLQTDLTALYAAATALGKQKEVYQATLLQLKPLLCSLMEFTDFASAKTAAAAAVRDFDRCEKESLTAHTALEECGKAERTLRQILLRYQTDLDGFRKSLDKLCGVLPAAEKEYESRLAARAANHVAAQLSAGDTCPVCGGIYRADRSGSGDSVSGGSDGAAEAKRALDSLRAEIKTAEKQVAEVDSLIKTQLSKIESENKKMQELQQRLTGCQNALGKIKLKSKADCERLLRASEDAFLTNQRLEQSQIEGEKIQSKLQYTTAALQEVKSQQDELKRRLSSLVAEIKQKGGENAEAQRQSLADLLATQIKFLQEHENRQKMAAENVSSIGAELAEKSKEYSLLGETKPVVFAPAEYENAEALYRGLLGEKSALAEKQGVIKQQVFECNSGLKQKKDADTELKRLSGLADRLDTLKKLLRGDRFLEFIADEYICDFTQDASLILSGISGGKYSLGYEQGEGKFFVCDYLSGGKKRKVGTLSGGEIFLASLSLASAVARHISLKNYDFFFLDEGFGTLDLKTMDMVADALAQLSRSGMVGVISHRRELVERIPARVRVDAPSEDKGSRIVVEN